MQGLPIHHQLPESTQTHVHWVSDAIYPSYPLLPLLLKSSMFPSIRDFFNESALCIRWPKYWRFSFSLSPSSDYSGLISFRIDWLDLLAVQGTLRSLLQHHNSKASILWHSSFLWSNSYLPYSNLPLPLPLCNGLETNCLAKMVAMKTSSLEAPREGKNGFGALPNLHPQRIATIRTVWQITGKGPF